jgi:hypothetical protein
MLFKYDCEWRIRLCTPLIVYEVREAISNRDSLDNHDTSFSLEISWLRAWSIHPAAEITGRGQPETR